MLRIFISPDVVYQFCQQPAYSAIVLPSHRRYVGASSYPFLEYRRKPGDGVGHNWRIPNVEGRRAVRHVLYGTNYWKSFVWSRVAARSTNASTAPSGSTTTGWIAWWGVRWEGRYKA